MLKEVIGLETLEKGRVKLNIQVFDAALEAINTKWESLMFSHNEESFISIKSGKHVLDMVTNGEVSILSEDGKEYTNSDYKFIRDKVVSKEIYSNKFNIDTSNYFAIMYSKSCEDNQYESIEENTLDSVELSTIKTIDELIEFAVNFAVNEFANIEDSSALEIIPFKTIGEILDDGTIERDSTSQGQVYWSEEAFLKRKGICYVPELSETKYTFEDFMRITKGNEDIANQLFYTVDWECPETLYQAWLDEDEVNECVGCQKAYQSYETETCPYCGHAKEL